MKSVVRYANCLHCGVLLICVFPQGDMKGPAWKAQPQCQRSKLPSCASYSRAKSNAWSHFLGKKESAMKGGNIKKPHRISIEAGDGSTVRRSSTLCSYFPELTFTGSTALFTGCSPVPPSPPYQRVYRFT